MNWLLLLLILAMGGYEVKFMELGGYFFLYNNGFSDEHCWVELTDREIEVFMPAKTFSRKWRIGKFVDWGCY